MCDVFDPIKPHAQITQTLTTEASTDCMKRKRLTYNTINEYEIEILI